MTSQASVPELGVSETINATIRSKTSSRLKLTDVNPNLTCILCKGYFIDAATITECLHSFCKSCIVRYLATSKQCPKCDAQVHKTKPLLHIRSDKTLQDMIYKLVPGLYKSEIRRRRQFYAQHPNSGGISSEEKGEIEDRIIYSPDEKISLSLEFYTQQMAEQFQKKFHPKVISDDGINTIEQKQNVVCRRYLCCPAAVPVNYLQKFIKFKFELSSVDKVDIIYSGEVLKEEWTLMDIAYIYMWKRNGPIRLFFRILHIRKPCSEKKVQIKEPKKTVVPPKVNDVTNDTVSKEANKVPETVKSVSKPSEEVYQEVVSTASAVPTISKPVVVASNSQRKHIIVPAVNASKSRFFTSGIQSKPSVVASVPQNHRKTQDNAVTSNHHRSESSKTIAELINERAREMKKRKKMQALINKNTEMLKSTVAVVQNGIASKSPLNGGQASLHPTSDGNREAVPITAKSDVPAIICENRNSIDTISKVQNASFQSNQQLLQASVQNVSGTSSNTQQQHPPTNKEFTASVNPQSLEKENKSQDNISSNNVTANTHCTLYKAPTMQQEQIHALTVKKVTQQTNDQALKKQKNDENTKRIHNSFEKLPVEQRCPAENHEMPKQNQEKSEFTTEVDTVPHIKIKIAKKRNIPISPTDACPSKKMCGDNEVLVHSNNKPGEEIVCNGSLADNKSGASSLENTTNGNPNIPIDPNEIDKREHLKHINESASENLSQASSDSNDGHDKYIERGNDCTNRKSSPMECDLSKSPSAVNPDNGGQKSPLAVASAQSSKKDDKAKDKHRKQKSLDEVVKNLAIMGKETSKTGEDQTNGGKLTAKCNGETTKSAVPTTTTTPLDLSRKHLNLPVIPAPLPPVGGATLIKAAPTVMNPSSPNKYIHANKTTTIIDIITKPVTLDSKKSKEHHSLQLMQPVGVSITSASPSPKVMQAAHQHHIYDNAQSANLSPNNNNNNRKKPQCQSPSVLKKRPYVGTSPTSTPVGCNSAFMPSPHMVYTREQMEIFKQYTTPQLVNPALFYNNMVSRPTRGRPPKSKKIMK